MAVPVSKNLHWLDGIWLPQAEKNAQAQHDPCQKPIKIL
jgi:hypothetical protein